MVVAEAGVEPHDPILGGVDDQDLAGGVDREAGDRGRVVLHVGRAQLCAAGRVDLANSTLTPVVGEEQRAVGVHGDPGGAAGVVEGLQHDRSAAESIDAEIRRVDGPQLSCAARHGRDPHDARQAGPRLAEACREPDQLVGVGDPEVASAGVQRHAVGSRRVVVHPDLSQRVARGGVAVDPAIGARRQELAPLRVEGGGDHTGGKGKGAQLDPAGVHLQGPAGGAVELPAIPALRIEGEPDHGSSLRSAVVAELRTQAGHGCALRDPQLPAGRVEGEPPARRAVLGGARRANGRSLRRVAVDPSRRAIADRQDLLVLKVEGAAIHGPRQGERAELAPGGVAPVGNLVGGVELPALARGGVQGDPEHGSRRGGVAAELGTQSSQAPAGAGQPERTGLGLHRDSVGEEHVSGGARVSR